jgi:hypothetical protein
MQCIDNLAHPTLARCRLLTGFRLNSQQERELRPVPHAVVDWLYPALEALQACEETLVHVDSTLPWDDSMVVQVCWHL